MGEGRNLVVLNVTTPSSPSKVGQVTLPGIVPGVKLLGQYAYVADGEAGLQVVDIGTPATPKIAGSYATTNEMWAIDIAIYGGTVYVADQIAGLQVFHLATPLCRHSCRRQALEAERVFLSKGRSVGHLPILAQLPAFSSLRCRIRLRRLCTATLQRAVCIACHVWKLRN